MIGGFTSSDDLKRITLEANKTIGLEIDSSKAISGSDHVPFYQKELPVLGFFTGLHADYHRTTDTVEKCNNEGSAQICKLVYKVAWTLAERDQRPKYKPRKK